MSTERAISDSDGDASQPSLPPEELDVDLTEIPESEQLEGFGSPVADAVYALLAPVAASIGAEIVDVEWAGGILRVVADREGGMNTDGLAEVNRLVSPLLDQHDPVPGRYTLEVSSPGVERKLRRSAHYRRAVGEVVIVKQRPGIEPRRLKGILASFDGGRLTVDASETDGIDLAETESFTVELADVDSAKTHFEWGPTPKKNPQPKSKKSKNKKNASQRGGGGKPRRDAKRNTTKEERGRP